VRLQAVPTGSRPAIFGPLRTHGFAFDVEALVAARARGLRMREVGVEWVSSEDTRVRPLRDAARMTLELLRLRGIV
jgi:dolichyl-phosphate beta-glucosyltransferase